MSGHRPSPAAERSRGPALRGGREGGGPALVAHGRESWTWAKQNLGQARMGRMCGAQVPQGLDLLAQGLLVRLPAGAIQSWA